MWSQKRVEMVVRKSTLQGQKANFLQDHIAIRIGEDLLLYLIASVNGRIGEAVKWNSGLPGHTFEGAIPLLFRKVLPTISNKEFLITRASLVHSRKVNLI